MSFRKAFPLDAIPLLRPFMSLYPQHLLHHQRCHQDLDLSLLLPAQSLPPLHLHLQWIFPCSTPLSSTTPSPTLPLCPSFPYLIDMCVIKREIRFLFSTLLHVVELLQLSCTTHSLWPPYTLTPTLTFILDQLYQPSS